MLEFPRLLARPPSGTGGPSLVGLSVSHPISETWPLFGILQQEGKTQGLSVSKNSLGGLKQLFSVCRRGTSLSWCPALLTTLGSLQPPAAGSPDGSDGFVGGSGPCCSCLSLPIPSAWQRPQEASYPRRAEPLGRGAQCRGHCLCQVPASGR